jgi:hypothetical protein
MNIKKPGNCWTGYHSNSAGDHPQRRIITTGWRPADARTGVIMEKSWICSPNL